MSDIDLKVLRKQVQAGYAFHPEGVGYLLDRLEAAERERDQLRAWGGGVLEVQVLYLTGDDPLIFALNGKASMWTLGILNAALLEDESDIFVMGEGSYRLRCVWQLAERESCVPAGYELDLLSFTPLDAMSKERGEA